MADTSIVALWPGRVLSNSNEQNYSPSSIANSSFPVGTPRENGVQLNVDQFSPTVRSRIESCINAINQLKDKAEPILHFQLGAFARDRSKLMLHVYHMERLTLTRWTAIKLACEKFNVVNPTVRFDGHRLHHCDSCKIGSLQLHVNVKLDEIKFQEPATLPSSRVLNNHVKTRWWKRLSISSWFPNPLRTLYTANKEEQKINKKRKPTLDDSAILNDLETERLNVNEDGDIRVPEDVATQFAATISENDDRILGFEIIKTLYTREKINKTRTELFKDCDYFSLINEIPVAETISYQWVLSIYRAHSGLLTSNDITVQMEHNTLVVKVNKTAIPKKAILVSSVATAQSTSTETEGSSPSQKKKQRTE